MFILSLETDAFNMLRGSSSGVKHYCNAVDDDDVVVVVDDDDDDDEISNRFTDYCCTYV